MNKLDLVNLNKNKQTKQTTWVLTIILLKAKAQSFSWDMVKIITNVTDQEYTRNLLS